MRTKIVVLILFALLACEKEDEAPDPDWFYEYLCTRPFHLYEYSVNDQHYDVVPNIVIDFNKDNTGTIDTTNVFQWELSDNRPYNWTETFVHAEGVIFIEGSFFNKIPWVQEPYNRHFTFVFHKQLNADGNILWPGIGYDTIRHFTNGKIYNYYLISR